MMTRFARFALVIFATATISNATISSVGLAQEFYDPAITRAWLDLKIGDSKDVTFSTSAVGFTTPMQDGKMQPLELSLLSVEARKGIAVSFISSSVNSTENIKIKLKVNVKGVGYGAYPVTLTFVNAANNSHLKIAILVRVN
jgi:hypothetical protein